MMNCLPAVAVLVAAISISTPSVYSHEISWRTGTPRTVGFGHCAKGPCMRRATFDVTVPHRHLGNGQCEGKGAAGFRFGSRFKC